MPSSLSPFRIAILGAGRIGSAYAFQLSHAGGHDVTVIARLGSKRLQQLERDGAIIDQKGRRAPVRVSSALDEAVPYDLVIVTVLAHQVGVVLPSLERSSAKCIQFMFNMVDPEKLRAKIGLERSAFGMQFIQANLDDDGRLTTKIGAGQKVILSNQSWVDMFNAAGLPATLEPEMPLWLRCHAPICIAFESVSVAGVRHNGASWHDALVLARGVRESFKLIKGLGYTLYPQSKRRLAGLPIAGFAALLWTVSRIRSFRELLATGEAECCALIDDLIAQAPLAKPPVRTTVIQAMRP